MAKPSKKAVVAALLDRHGTTYADEAGIALEKGTPSPLFRLLCLSLLQSARISSDIAMRAAKGLAKRRWNTAGAMLQSTWQQRVDVLNEGGYTRYQERTATMLEDTARLLDDRWNGDLRNLRAEAGRDPGAERKLLKEFKGVGDVGSTSSSARPRRPGASSTPSPTAGRSPAPRSSAWAARRTTSPARWARRSSSAWSPPSSGWSWPATTTSSSPPPAERAGRRRPASSGSAPVRRRRLLRHRLVLDSQRAHRPRGGRGQHRPRAVRRAARRPRPSTTPRAGPRCSGTTWSARRSRPTGG